MSNGDDTSGVDDGTLAQQAQGYRLWNAMGTPQDHATQQAYRAASPFHMSAIPRGPVGNMPMTAMPNDRPTPVRTPPLQTPPPIQMPPNAPVAPGAFDQYRAPPVQMPIQQPAQAPPVTVNPQVSVFPQVGGAPAPGGPPGAGMGQSPANIYQSAPSPMSRQEQAAEAAMAQRNRMAASMGNPALLGAPSDWSSNPLMGGAGMAGGGF